MAAKKKEFNATVPAQTAAHETIIGNADPAYFVQEEPDAQEVREAQEAWHTQGRRGFGMPRLNIGFTPTNLEYVRTMSRVKGVSQSVFVNQILDKYREETGETYEELKRLIELI